MQISASIGSNFGANQHNTMTKLTFPQESIDVDVDYYDETSKADLSSYPSSQTIATVVREGVQIPTSEFLTYYLFGRKRPGYPGWTSYEELAQKIHTALADLDGFIEFNGTSICMPAKLSEPDNRVTERVGESVALAVTNRIHNLTQADWDRIPAKGGRGAVRSFDYGYGVRASDGNHTVQVEAKGSVVDDGRTLSQNLRSHRKSIGDKKQKIAEKENLGEYPWLSDIRYGAITSIDYRPDGILKCRLVDPPGESDDAEPRRVRLLSRIRYIRDWIVLLGGRSMLATALNTRVAALEAMENPFELEGIPLLRGDGEPFQESQWEFTGEISGWFASKSRVSDGPTGGMVVQTGSNLIFLGIRRDLLELAEEQSFEELMNYSVPAGRIWKEVHCVISAARFKRSFNVPESVTNNTNGSGGYVTFKLEGELHYGSSGVVFGILPLPVNKDR